MAANSFFMAPAGRGALVGRNEADDGQKPTTRHRSSDVSSPSNEGPPGSAHLGLIHARERQHYGLPSG